MTKLPPATPPASDYAYGDNPVALQRLLLLAKVFAPCSETLLGRLPLRKPDVVIDLGCGPGETTRLLCKRFPQAQTIGIDASPELVSAAAARQPRAISFAVGDVTRTPISGAPADLIYARLLLAHLRKPTEVVSSWTRQLRPGGILALEEVEQISTEDQLFQDYLQIATSALQARGTELFVGPTLHQMEPPAGTKMVSTVHILQPSSQDVATMFALNLDTLRRDESIKTNYSQRALDAIAGALGARAKETDGPAIAWEMRQLVLIKDGSQCDSNKTDSLGSNRKCKTPSFAG
jgi:trans-aconitate 2-methyltransferase